MTITEIAFLALGLVLGIAVGAALLEVIRSRPSAREIRVTVTPGSIPRRVAATLAVTGDDAASGGPVERGEAPAAVDLIAIPIHPEPDPTLESLRRATVAAGALGPETEPPRAPGSGEGGRGTVVTEGAAEGAPRGVAVLAPPANAATAPRAPGGPPRAPGGPPRAPGGRRSRASAEAAAGVRSADGTPGGTDTPLAEAAGTSTATGDETSFDRCRELRRQADERCAAARAARDRAASAQDALRTARREYDDRLVEADRATAIADPRAVRARKDAAQAAYRAARASAGNVEAAGDAARDWLAEINRINTEARGAAVTAARAREAATALVARVERLALEADAARIAAEAADATCLEAMEAVARCDEQLRQEGTSGRAAPTTALQAAEEAARATVAVAPSTTGQLHEEPARGNVPEEKVALVRAMARGEPRIVRLLRGDRAALGTIVDRLADGGATERHRWEAALTRLVDRLTDLAVQSSYLEFPESHRFWGHFSRSECREVVAALAALGYRFDGRGGWVDGRIPSQRDLSLAIGYAGQDPVRIRFWPTQREMAHLLADVTLAMEEYLAASVAGLTLAEVVPLLDDRAGELTMLWSEWGRVRPLLLAVD